MIALSFLPWVSFEGDDLVNDGTFSFGVSGTELSRLRGPDYYQPADIADQQTDVCTCRTDFGDGYLTAALGAVVAIAAVVGLVLSARRRVASLVAIGASLGAFIVAGYNAAGEWQAIGAAAQDDPFVEMTGSVEPALIALTGIAAISAVLGSILLWMELQQADIEYEEDDEQTEETLENYLVWQ
jgi:hypothetical protein